MAYFSFTSPLYLNFLFLIPFVILVNIWTVRGRNKKAIKFANIEAIERISGVEIFSKNLTAMFINIVLIVFLTLALSGTALHMQKRASSFSYVLAIDASSSMSADDILPSRIAAAKQAAKDFIDTVPLSTKIGVVSFSGVSYIELEMTQDKRILKDAIDTIDIKPAGGTNILDAIVTSVNVMKGEDSKAVILLSDGQLNINSVEEIIDYAKKHDTIVHTIAIGTREGGNAEYFVSKVDEDALKGIAYNTNGKYYSITDAEGFGGAFKDIAVSTTGVVAINLSVYLLMGCLVLIFLQWILVNTRWRVIP